VKAGDRVLFGKYSGTEIKVEDEDYLILREDESLPSFPARLRLRAAEGNFSPARHGGCGAVLFENPVENSEEEKDSWQANCDW